MERISSAYRALPLLCALACARAEAPSASAPTRFADAPATYRTSGRVRDIDGISVERNEYGVTGINMIFYTECKNDKGERVPRELRIHISRCGGTLDHLADLSAGDKVFTRERFETEIVDVCGQDFGPVR